MHRSPRLSGFLTLLLGVVAGVGTSGCGGMPEATENQAPDHLRKIGQAYDLVLLKHRRPPRSAADLKPFLKELTKQEDPDIFLRSPNDGQLYEVVWGVKLDDEEDLHALLAHEKKGVGGKRYVITVSRIVKTLTDAEFSKATYPKGKRPVAAK